MTFEDVLEIKNGKNQRAVENPNGKYPIYGSGGIMGYADDYICNANTVIIGRKGNINKPIFVFDPFWNVDTAFGLEAKRELLLPRYLYYFCLRYDFEHLNKAVTIPSLTKADLLKINIDIPKIDTQTTIVDRLGKIEQIISFRNNQLRLLENLIKARFVELLGDPRQNPNGYEVHELSEYIEFLTSGSRGWAKYYVDDGKEWFITIKNVKDCKIATDNMQPVNAPDNAEAKRTRVQEGDLLISITADLGRTGVITKEIADHGAYINQHLTLIRLNQEYLEPLYVAYFMESTAGKEQFISKNQSAVKAGLNFNSINTLKLLVPPKDIQQEFLSFVAQVDKSKSHKKTNYKTNNKLAS